MRVDNVYFDFKYIRDSVYMLRERASKEAEGTGGGGRSVGKVTKELITLQMFHQVH